MREGAARRAAYLGPFYLLNDNVGDWASKDWRLQDWKPFLVIVPLGATLLSHGMAKAQDKIGNILPYSSETPHPYAVGTLERPIVWQETVVSPGAKLLRIHFVGFSLAPGDYLSISTSDGFQTEMYQNSGPYGDGEFWSLTMDGDEAIISLHGGLSPGYGYRIDSVAHGELSLEEGEVLEPTAGDCKSGFENVACHKENKIFWAGQKPVAKLTYMENGKMAVATGWLVTAKDKNTLITAAHNFVTDKIARTADAIFNYQTSTCEGGQTEKTERFHVFKVLEWNDRDNYDYILVNLMGDAEKTWGALRPNTTDIKEKSQIWIPQHPGGEVKQVGWFSDKDHKAHA